jgi:hypothetical protein
MTRLGFLALSVLGCFGQDGPLGGTNLTARGVLTHAFSGDALCVDITGGWNPNSKLDLARCQDGNIAMLFTTWAVSGQYYFTTGPTGNLHQYCISKASDMTELVLNLCTVSGPDFLWRINARTLRNRGGLCMGTSTTPVDKAPLFVSACTGAIGQNWAIDKLPFGEGSGGLSGGSIFLVLLVVGFSVYIIVGCLFNVVKNKTAPADACPQKAFWTDFCPLVKDGCRFVMSKLSGGKGGTASYNEL